MYKPFYQEHNIKWLLLRLLLLLLLVASDGDHHLRSPRSSSIDPWLVHGLRPGRGTWNTLPLADWSSCPVRSHRRLLLESVVALMMMKIKNASSNKRATGGIFHQFLPVHHLTSSYLIQFTASRLVLLGLLLPFEHLTTIKKRVA